MTTQYPIFDGHNDTLLDLYKPDRGKGRSFFERSEHGHIDLPRAQEGHFGGGFFAIYTPAEKKDGDPPTDLDKLKPSEPQLGPPVEYAHALRTTLAMAALLFRLERQSNGQFRVVRTADELAACLRDRVVAAIFHIEGAEAISEELHELEVLYQAGLRSLGIVWSRSNIFGHGVPFQFPHSPDTGPGLTDAGKALVKECNRLGIMIDLSHMNEKGFWDVAKLSDAPLVATHSNVHALCQMTRNLTDRQLDAIKESDGMVGLNYASAFLREDGKNDPDIPLEVMVRHIDYLVERVGLNRVGLGSDFDGAKVPNEIRDVTGVPRLVDALRKAGYDEESLRKITHENWVRVLRKTWKS